MKKVWCVHTHTGISFSHKNKQNLAIGTTWVDPESLMLSKMSHSDKDKYHSISLWVEFKKDVNKEKE